MLEMTRTDPEWKDKIITGYETWVYGYDPETKHQSAEWRCQDIAPNDFFLFPKLKAVLKGRHFDTRDDIIEKSPLALKIIPKEAYKNCFDNWEKRWRCVVMKSNREFENRAAIIVALRAGRSPKEIVDFLKLPKTTIYRVKKQFDEADSNKEGIATRKKHSRRSDMVRGEEFVKNVKEKIDGNPGKSMRAIAKEMDVGSMTIVRTIHEDLGLKSYALRKGQLLTKNMKNNRKGKAAALLNNLKHDSFGMLRFFSDEKNFDVDQKVNPRNDRWICKDPSEIPVVMHTKFPASVMVLGVISSEGDVMPPHFFEKGLRMNADTYINVLETVVKPWMDMVAAGRKAPPRSTPLYQLCLGGILQFLFIFVLATVSISSKVFWIVFDFYLIKKMDQRTCIKFCVKNEIKCADAFRMLTVAYGEATLDRSNVYRWYKMFSEGREDVNDEERAGRPSTSTTDEKINEVEKMILANRRITVREVAEDLNISIGSCHSIFINDLGMRRVAAKFVPKLLNCDQKQHRMNIANEMLDSVRDDPNLLQRVITGDEAWVYGYDVETKAQSSQWKLPHEPRPKKARQVRSNVKVLLTVFFDCRGVVHHEFLPQG
ncbi:hypothetical protein LAZ67_13000463 [Cordylochernes scorpioides]|uniref:Mos1 transposase HTH domain-containing protein n=1 Tax=Cordylochernes scorpioides TaxID=51811 RepID=A0ABY6L303_9ARAC|nr:hypothetical protein LAZ67_13000463 [Cordylochernes scorpioides]